MLPLGDVITGEDGRFVIDNVDPGGGYHVRAEDSFALMRNLAFISLNLPARPSPKNPLEA